MKVEEALQAGLDKAKKGREWSKARLLKKAPTTSSVLSFFARECTANGYSSEVLLSKEQRGMVSGLVKFCLNNKPDEMDWVYGFLKKVIEQWPDLSKKVIQTDKSGKQIALHSRPNIVDVCICKQSLIAYVYCEEAESSVTERAEIKAPTPVKTSRRVDKAAEIDAEMGESYYDD